MKSIDNSSGGNNLTGVLISKKMELSLNRSYKGYKNMDSHSLMNGVLAPVITPFDENLEPDAQKLSNHCRWLLHNDVGLAVFGTNSEANSMSTEENFGFTMEKF